MFNQDQIKEIQKMIDLALKNQGRQKLVQSDIPPGTIKRRHLEDVPIVFGEVADLPSDGGDVGVRAYFATDTNTLYCWNGSAWVSEVLT